MFGHIAVFTKKMSKLLDYLFYEHAYMPKGRETGGYTGRLDFWRHFCFIFPMIPAKILLKQGVWTSGEVSVFYSPWFYKNYGEYFQKSFKKPKSLDFKRIFGILKSLVG